MHSKLPFCLLFLTDQLGERVARHCGLLPVSVNAKRIEDYTSTILNCPFKNLFQFFFSEKWEIMSDPSFPCSHLKKDSDY